MAGEWDVIVIGSGFGGAVMACRLAEAGRRVLVLERGRRWGAEEFPDDVDSPWIWNDNDPAHHNGWLDFRVFKRMAVAQGAAVGGGSLIYANISLEATPDTFDAGWPPEITYNELAPHYRRVAETMNVQPVPANQWPNRTKLMHEAAEAIGEGGRFRQLDLAVTFDPSWTPHPADPPDAHDPSRSRRFVNAEGIEQGTCVHLGRCDIGCPVLARNTLDLNYLARAERHGAEVRPLHLVRAISRRSPDRGAEGGGGERGGFRVHVQRIVDGTLVGTHEDAPMVVVAAGSLGSTELLLRCRDLHRTLPDLPRDLGRGWSSNGDFLTLGIHEGRDVDPTRGPTITSAIDFRDGSQDGQRFLIEDGGFPDLVNLWLDEARGWFGRLHPGRVALAPMRQALRGEGSFAPLMPWFAQGVDAANGQLHLRRRYGLFGRRQVGLRWSVARSRPMFDAIGRMHERLARATGGRTIVPLTWTLGHYLITPHPLGGCRMSSDPTHGVVDHAGRVWGTPGLYVVDGSIVPTAIGANPSRTIAALAERAAAIAIAEGR